MSALTVLTSLGMILALHGAPGSAMALDDSSGIFPGEDLEWSEEHLLQHADDAKHAAYHSEKEAEENAWHAMHDADKGTDAYEELHREFHQRMNRGHRAFHRGLLEEEKMCTMPRHLPGSGC